MHDALISEERILAIQEAMCGFIVEQVLDTNGEYYYDGETFIVEQVSGDEDTKGEYTKAPLLRPKPMATGLRFAPSEVGLFLCNNLDHNITNSTLRQIPSCSMNQIII